MCLLLCLLLAFDDTEIVRYEGTEVYQPLQLKEILVAPNGHVYILNFPEAQILRYAPKGDILGKFGAKGKGPGEFTYAVQIFYQDGNIYVYDLLTTEISVFDEEGTFKNRFAAPGRGLTFAKTKTGWVYGNWSMFGQETAELFVADPEFKETRKVLTLDEKGTRRGLWVMSNDGKTKAEFSPFDSSPRMRPRHDGKAVYVTHPTKFLIYIVDQGGHITEMEHKDQRVPFDEDWANEGLAQWKKDRPNLSKIDTYYPKYFPAIRELMVDPKGNLVVNRWRGRPDDYNHPIALTEAGGETKAAYTWEVLERLAGFTANHVYLTIFNTETEEGGLARVPAIAAEQFIKDNPIEFEGSSGHSISISL